MLAGTAVMRDITVIIDRIVVVDPALAVHLSSIKSSAVFTAPEGQSHLWRKLCVVLNEVAGTHERGDEIQRIVAGDA